MFGDAELKKTIESELAQRVKMNSTEKKVLFAHVDIDGRASFGVAMRNEDGSFQIQGEIHKDENTGLGAGISIFKSF